MTETEELEFVKKHAEDLGEHFDSVQIFTTRHVAGDENGTVNVSYGVGNWFARFGQIFEWLTKSNERTKQYVRREENEN